MMEMAYLVLIEFDSLPFGRILDPLELKYLAKLNGLCSHQSTSNRFASYPLFGSGCECPLTIFLSFSGDT
ncbi:MAG: hypothetical protein P8173_14890, partial [Gammaproteobacteria bacterium]